MFNTKRIEELENSIDEIDEVLGEMQLDITFILNRLQEVEFKKIKKVAKVIKKNK